MEVQFGPNAVDDPNLLYKLQRKVKVFNTSNSLPNRGYNLLSTSTKYGIVFVASPHGVLSVYNIKELIDPECETRHISINLQVEPTHIAVNCDHEWLAVVGGQMLFVYKVCDFQNPNVGPAITIRCEVNPSTYLSALQWNPCIPDTIALVYFDGTLVICQVNTMQKKQIQSLARCLCWSPKGKQLVTGNADGTLCQYKPDLSPMKSVAAPNLFEGAPVEALAIHWISTFQFAVVFRNASNSSRPAVTIVNTPKGGTPNCLNYEDICYSLGSNRPWFYYLQGLAQWNLIMTASSNSMEIATLGSKDGLNWVQWCQSDEARPELPLTNKTQENYPVGLCIDTCAAHQLPWGENELLPPMPILLVVSHTGLLTIFNIVNLDKTCAQICTSIQALQLPEAAFTSDVPSDMPPQPQETAPTQTTVVQQPQSVLQQPQPVLQQPQPVLQQPQPISQQSQQAQATVQQSLSFAQQPLQQHAPKAELTSLFSGSQLTASLLSTPKQPTPQMPTPTPEQIATKALTVAEIEKSKAEAMALKSAQEKANKARVEQELKSMLIKEVNEFQQELYKFRVMISKNQIKIQQQIESVEPNLDLHSLDSEQLKKECKLEELRESVVQLKLDLIRAYAVVAESKTHAETKEYFEWNQTDPLTVKRFTSIKKLAYYVQNQLDQAQKELNYKWDEMIHKTEYGKPGQRMIRPILDDVYQPLVKQQEILGRQQAVLRTLKNTLNECNSTPMFKSTSLLRSTPFKNKDPLSKLTKNILNMSIEPQNNKDKELSSQKLDSLRDMLSNHRPKKIKPVSVELRQHLEAMRQKYEKAVKDRAEKRDIEKQTELYKQEQINLDVERVKAEKQELARITEIVAKEQKIIEAHKQKQVEMAMQKLKTELPVPAPQVNAFVKTEPKSAIKEQPISIPSFSLGNSTSLPKPAFASVSRNLFNEGVKPESSKAQSLQSPIQSLKIDAKQSSLQDHLQKEIDNMIPKVCSPIVFSGKQMEGTPKETTNAPGAVSSSNPIGEISSMFSKYTQSTTKPQVKPSATSDETGEMESSTVPIKPLGQTAKENKPLQNIFSLKTSTPLTNVQNVPDVLKGNQIFAKAESKPKEELEKPKENVPQTTEIKITPVKKDEPKPISVQSISSPSSAPAQPVFVVDLKKPSEIKIEKSLPASFFNSTSTSFATSIQVTTAAEVTATITPKTSVTTSNVVTSKEAPKADIDVEKTNTQMKPVAFVTSEIKNTPVSSAALQTTEEPTSPNAKTVFSGASKSLFSSPSAPDAKPLFGSSSVTITSSTQATPTTPPEFATSTYGHSVSSPTTPQDLTTPTTASPFGSAQSVFSAANKTVFGAATTSTQSIFGTATQAPTFGGSAFSSSQSVFGSSSTPSSVFGTAAQSAFGPTTQAPFGASTTQSVFGAPSTTPSGFGSSSPASVFGSATSQQNPFGQTVFGSATSTSVFGSTGTTPSSVFGTTTTSQSGSLFGDGGANLFASASISTTGSSTPSGSLFRASPGCVFGAKSTFSGSNPTAASIFGGGASLEQKPAANFWGSSTNSSGFGSSAFGQPATTQGSVFGSTGGSFSQPSGEQPFGTPQKSVFGSPQQQTAPAFGGSPVFGSKPVFGSSPSFGGSAFGGVNKSPSSGFGSSATFGGGATFGGSGFGNTSPSQAFGAAASGFGSPTQSNSTFENLANQNTLTFGNLAHQSSQPAAPAPSFNTSPSFTGWRG
ncbi:unnamed protein product [Leptosia nina]|uniref:Nuclear pore complex protein Nup214 n=1 Tax=Leptosia nina TaxID=320188 RepID=A0AAV1JF59_9NEOP